MSTGTIEEKVFQRQLSKEGLQNIVDDKEEVRCVESARFVWDEAAAAAAPAAAQAAAAAQATAPAAAACHWGAALENV